MTGSFQTIRPRLARLSRLGQQFISDPRVGWAILFAATLAPFFGVGHGHDFLMHYQRRTLSGDYGVSTWLPYYGYWLIWPFAILPPRWALLSWNLVNALGLGLLCRRWGVSPLSMALVFPTLYMFGNGQIAGIMALGVVLALSPRPLLAGLGLAILSVKPQVTGLVGLYVLWRHFNWRLFVIPALVFAVSLLAWGWWVPEWLASLSVSRAGLEGTAWNASAFPWGLIALPWLWRHRNQPAVWLTLTPLVSPYYAIYSLALPLTVGLPGWGWLLTWVVSLIYIFGGYTPLWAIVTLLLIYQAGRLPQHASKVTPAAAKTA